MYFTICILKRLRLLDLAACVRDNVYKCVDLISSTQFYAYVDRQYDIQVLFFKISLCIAHHTS